MFATLPPSDQNPRSSFLTSESQTHKSSAPAVSSRIESDRMENNSEAVPRQEDPMGLQLPAGFQFHPTDEELVTHYLMKKVLEADFTAIAIAEVDMNKVEPWELPWKAKLGEREWYFFCITDKKYPTGLRKNRATPCGYWKATGKDKEIFDSRKALAGMKKTLVFYNGRAPKGVKTDWICHEYRLEGENSPKSTKDHWVISRVFQKASGGKKARVSGPTGTNSLEPNEAITQPNPPLATDPSPSQGAPCFSNHVPEDDGAMINSNDHNNPSVAGSSASNPITDPRSPLTKQFDDFADLIDGFDDQFPGSVSSLIHDPLSVGQNQVGGYLDYDADEGFVWREEKKNVIGGPQENTAAVRTEDPLVAPNPEMGKKDKSLGGEEEARVGELYDIGGFWDFANI